MRTAQDKGVEEIGRFRKRTVRSYAQGRLSRADYERVIGQTDALLGTLREIREREEN